jgi:hypothetical protein
MLRGWLATFIAILTLALTGCPHTPEPPVSATTRPLDTTDRYSDEDLRKWLTFDNAREYYNGDGLGENLNLLLLAGGHYSLTWNGCLGLYGAAAGKWRVENRHLLLDPEEEKGSLAESPVRRLHMRVIGDRLILIEDRKLDWLQRYGVDEFGCFVAIREL